MSDLDVNSTERFSSRVEHYRRCRPTYPEGVLQILREEIGLRPDWLIADIGAGTGISAELFLRNGHVVYAVEPNAVMRAAAEKELAEYRGFHSVTGTAEATTLPEASVDCVVAAQAFHWFDAAKTRREFKRILHPGGWVVLLWNARRLTATAFLREYESLLLKFGTDYERVRHERVDDRALADFFGGTSYVKRSVENFQRLDFEGLRGRLLSSSYVPATGEAGYAEMLDELKRLFERRQRDGQVAIEYDAEIFAGQLA
jgi:SAM-dependent methyltransferase